MEKGNTGHLGPDLAQPNALGAPASNLGSPAPGSSWLERSVSSQPGLFSGGRYEGTPGTRGQFAEEAPSQGL